MGIDENETAYQLSTQGSSHQLIQPESAHGMSAKAAREVIKGWTSWKHREYWQSICGQRQAKGFLKRPSAEELGNYSTRAETS
jgi:hypothetical protein